MSEINYLDLPDDEVEKLQNPAPVAETPAEEQEEIPSGSPEDNEQDEDDQEEPEADTEDGDSATAETTAESEVGEGSDGGAEKDESADQEEEKETPDTEPKEDDKGLSAEEQLAILFKPFNANGKEIKIDSVDEAIQLMQMGANYAKKMSALKPSLKVLKMLENNQLLDEGKLSHLIDLSKKNPDAIAKLLSDSGVDPLNVDLSKADEYKPGTYTVADQDMVFDEVMERVKATPTYEKTVDVIANKWDDSSKKILFNEPAVIEVINSHIASGIYDQIMSVVEKQRMLGGLTGLSDIAAYKAVGEQIFGNKPAQTVQANVSKEPVVIKKAPVAAVEDPAVKARKQAAASVKAKPATKTNNEFNPLEMSDEEFMRLTSNGHKY